MTNDDYQLYSERRQKRTRTIAWVAIIALVITGGGATVLSLLFG